MTPIIERFTSERDVIKHLCRQVNLSVRGMAHRPRERGLGHVFDLRETIRHELEELSFK